MHLMIFPLLREGFYLVGGDSSLMMMPKISMTTDLRLAS